MKPITVLIADDEPEIADLIELHLVKEGYRCIKAFDGLEAVQTIQTNPVDLAILDIMMPEMDGYEATAQIREKSHLPIIFLSAKSTDLDKIAGLIRGADDYMTKPFHPDELAGRSRRPINEVLSLLGGLEIAGVVEQGPGRVFRRV